MKISEDQVILRKASIIGRLGSSYQSTLIKYSKIGEDRLWKVPFSQRRLSVSRYHIGYRSTIREIWEFW